MKCVNSVFVTLLLIITCSATAAITPANDALTWGIQNSELTIPDGSIIINAKLTLHDVTAVNPANTDARLFVQLLDNPAAAITPYIDGQADNYFDGFGTAVATLTPQQFTNGSDYTIDLSQINDATSAVYNTFSNPFVQTLGDGSTVTLSSAILDLLDYTGTGSSFGFGIDCDGITIDGLTLEVTIQSTTANEPAVTQSFTYGNLNTAPVLATIAAANVNEGQPLTIILNGSDADNDPLTYSAENLPAGATLNGNTFNWTPTLAQAGVYNVTFIVSDGAKTAQQTATITVANVNQAPVINTIANQTIMATETLTFNVSAADPDGDTLTYTAQNLTAGAPFANQTFTWTPDIKTIGQFPVQFTVTDGQTSVTTSVIITVSKLNHAPRISTVKAMTVEENNYVSFGILIIDPDMDKVDFKLENMPAGASYRSGYFKWIPQSGQAGTYTVTLRASDGTTETVKTMTLTVEQAVTMH